MRKFFQGWFLAAELMLLGCVGAAYANYDATTGTGTHFVAFDATHSGTSLCAAANTQCVAFAVIDSAGAEKFTAANPATVTAIGIAQGSTTSGQTGSLVMGAVTTAPPSYTTAQSSPMSLDTSGGVRMGSQYPAGATPITASATGTTGATTTTLATGASVTTYICGFSIRANATAALTGNATVTGTITGTLNFTQWTAPLASGLGITEMIFNPCVPASAVNTGIAVVSAAPGSGGTVSSTAWGYTRAAQ